MSKEAIIAKVETFNEDKQKIDTEYFVLENMTYSEAAQYIYDYCFDCICSMKLTEVWGGVDIGKKAYKRILHDD